MDESTIQDYLTEFSGLEAGDLNPETSKYTVTTSKHVYLKLRRLADMGCRFVGHGLEKDFRIISTSPLYHFIYFIRYFCTEGTSN